MFPALGTGHMFSRPWNWLHVFPRLELVARFLRLAWVACRIPSLCTGNTFSQLACAGCMFPALGTDTGYMCLLPALIGSLF